MTTHHEPGPLTAIEADALEALAGRIAGYLALPFAELARALDPGTAVRAVAAERVSIFSVATDGVNPSNLIGQQLDRSAITIIAADANSWLGTGPEIAEAVAAAANGRMVQGLKLPSLIPVRLETRAELWVASSAASTVYAIAEQHDQ